MRRPKRHRRLPVALRLTLLLTKKVRRAMKTLDDLLVKIKALDAAVAGHLGTTAAKAEADVAATQQKMDEVFAAVESVLAKIPQPPPA